MSISTPDSNQGKDEQRENSRENAAPPRPSARRNRRAQHSADEVRDAQDTAEAAQSDADANDRPVDKGEPASSATGKNADISDDASAPTGKGDVPGPQGAEVEPAPEPQKPDTFDPTPAAQASGRRGLFGVSGSGDTSGMGGLLTQAGSGIPSVSSPRPYGGWFDAVADRFAKAYPQWDKALIATVADRGELTFYVEKSHIAKILQVARDDSQLRFELLSSVSGVDYFRGDAGLSSTGDVQQDKYRTQRLHVVYHLTSLTFRRRVRFEVATTVEDPHVPTASEVYPTADWQERETYDMFGVVFDGHHALTRILMPDDWEGFPQRKDYPLGGIDVEYKGASIPPPDQRRVYK
ncbi:NADH-quinone oxidoreductase subunit C [Cumulibacter manganitolerans]|uniref:NADH-quinone oxidoreductase subunit C n=1 Tax=Cumulibacter manganitolerans TaxID=1884992 RepID=UPI00129563AA|nr:NADH-quinone oxidoreductase subunit C [Cumulibacter manganitolerans]